MKSPISNSILVLPILLVASILAGCNTTCNDARNYESQISLMRSNLVNIINSKDPRYTAVSCAWLAKAGAWLSKKSPKLQNAAWSEPFVNDPQCNEDGFNNPFSRTRSGRLVFNSQTPRRCNRAQGHPDRVTALEQLSGNTARLAGLFNEMCNAPGEHTYKEAKTALALIDGAMKTNGATLLNSYCSIKSADAGHIADSRIEGARQKDLTTGVSAYETNAAPVNNGGKQPIN